MTAAAHRITGLRFPDGTNAPSGVFNIKDPLYGATGDGSTDDTTAIQAAYTAAAIKGGTVYWPSSNGERYTLTSTILASSIYPINSIGDMHGYCDNQTTGAFIRPGANFGATGMIKYIAPGGSHMAHGGGLIRGLSFYDNTNTNHTTNYTMLCAIDLTDFNLGKLQNCMFHVLNGGAVRAVQWVMGSMTDCVVRYCGTVSQPAISLEPTSVGLVQSTSFNKLKVEVNYGTYFSLNSNCSEVKISDVGFEADTTVTATNNTFIDNSGQGTFIANVHMNRNNATQLIFEAASNYGRISNVYVSDATTKTSNASVVISGGNHHISNLAIKGATAQTVAALQVSGAFCVFNNITVNQSGGVLFTGNAYNVFSNSIIASTIAGSVAYALDVSGGESDVTISNVLIEAPAINIGGIRVTGFASGTRVANCEVVGGTGTAIAFRDENSAHNTVWIGNTSSSNPTAFSASASAYIARGNSWGGVETETVAGPMKLAGNVGFYNTTPVAQPTSAANAHTVTAGSTTNVFTNTTFDGSTGSTAYTVGDLVKALKALGLITA